MKYFIISGTKIGLHLRWDFFGGGHSPRSTCLYDTYLCTVLSVVQLIELFAMTW